MTVSLVSLADQNLLTSSLGHRVLKTTLVSNRCGPLQKLVTVRCPNTHLHSKRKANDVSDELLPSLVLQLGGRVGNL